jgi:pimeloyl-ACP methyl ester carboxylesterase
MTDFLLIHGAGHGSWVWDEVHGILEDTIRPNSNLRHTMYSPGRILSPDLHGHGTRFPIDNPLESTFERCITELKDLIEKEKVQNLVIGVHSLSGLIGLELIRRLRTPPLGLVLVGAVIPDLFHNVLEMLPISTRIILNALRLQPGTPPKSVKLHREFGLKLLCHGMRYPEAASQILRRLNPIPLQPWDALPNPLALEPKCPITYQLLLKDKFLPIHIQKQMAGSFSNADIDKLDCGHEAPITNPREVARALLKYT